MNVETWTKIVTDPHPENQLRMQIFQAFVLSFDDPEKPRRITTIEQAKKAWSEKTFTSLERTMMIHKKGPYIEPSAFGRRLLELWQGVYHENRKCPECGAALELKKSKNKESFWTCFKKESHKSGRIVALPDVKGRPGQPLEKKEAPCPLCSGKVRLMRSQSNGAKFWACLNDDKHPDGKPVLLPDDKGKPGAELKGVA